MLIGCILEDLGEDPSVLDWWTYFSPKKRTSHSCHFTAGRYQSDVHSCGAWLIMALAAYVLGIEKAQSIFTRYMAFTLLMVLIENIDDKERRMKAISILNVNNNRSMNDSSEEEQEKTYEEFIARVKSSGVSTPLKRTKRSRHQDFDSAKN